MQKALLAVDGGGTKTEFALVSSSGNVLLTKKYGGSNLNNGREEAIQTLKTGTEEFLSIAKTYNIEVCSAHFGLAGGVNKDNLKTVYNTFKTEYFPDIPFYNYGDELNAINVALQGAKNGIAVIAGTGSNIILVKDGKFLPNPQVAGWGYLIDEGGCCGYDFGIEALRAVKNAQNKSGEQTVLTTKLENKLGGNTFDSLSSLYGLNAQQNIASLCPCVFEAYREEDCVARDIVKNQVSSLVEKINFCNQILEKPDDAVVGFVGSVFQGRDRDIMLVELAESNLDKNLSIQIPREGQIYGAVIVAAKLAGVEDDDTFRQNFDQTYHSPELNAIEIQNQ